MHLFLRAYYRNFSTGFLNNDGHFHSFMGVENGPENSSGGGCRIDAAVLCDMVLRIAYANALE
jgi:hypothetical protein